MSIFRSAVPATVTIPDLKNPVLGSTTEGPIQIPEGALWMVWPDGELEEWAYESLLEDMREASAPAIGFENFELKDWHIAQLSRVPSLTRLETYGECTEGSD